MASATGVAVASATGVAVATGVGVAVATAAGVGVGTASFTSISGTVAGSSRASDETSSSNASIIS